MPTQKKTARTPARKKAARSAVAKKGAQKKTATKKQPKARKAARRPTKKSSKKTIRIQNKTPKGQTLAISTSRLQLALVSPFRFPALYSKALAQSARVAGLTFVFVGAVFAALNLHAFELSVYTTTSPIATHLAATTCSEDGTLCEDDSTNTTTTNDSMDPCDRESSAYDEEQCAYENDSHDPCDPLSMDYDETYCALLNDSNDPCDPLSAAYDETQCTSESTTHDDNTATTESLSIDIIFDAPDPNLGYVEMSTNSRDIVSGIIDVLVHVADADAIEIFLKPGGGSSFKLGTASRASTADTWVYTWDTTKQSDGNYSLVAKVKKDGVVHESVPEYLSITNTSSGNDLTHSDPVIVTEFDDDEPLSGSVRLYTYLEGEHVPVTKIAVFVDNGLRGNAITHDSSKWSYLLDTTKLANGRHTYYVKIYFDDGSIHEAPSEIFEIDNNTSTTETDTTDTETAEPVTVQEDEDATTILQPEITLDIRASAPISGAVDVRIDAEGVQFVELYAIPRYALKNIFLGLAKKVDDRRWQFTWSTKNTPNGEYYVFARAKNEYGTYESARKLTKVHNQLETTDTETETIHTNTEALESEVDEAKDETNDPIFDIAEDGREEQSTESETAYVDQKVALLLKEFESELHDELSRLTSALRSGDEEAVLRIKKRLSDLKDDIVDSALSSEDQEALIDAIDSRLEEAISRLIEDTEKTEAIISERVGDEIRKDSDNDGITDFDEVVIYKTNPLAADTDGDGFTDGAEILSGYNPLDERPEVLVEYESPKESGIVREELVAVESIRTLPSIAGDPTGVGSPRAVISGRGLPNSFVTLYIFSTPIIVTVRTKDDGSWEYEFDKELEDGEHEVYVGITDNSGRIVAKSNPLAFVKTAQAFTPADAASVAPAALTDDGKPALLSMRSLLMVLSIIVVALGVVLLMIGMHVESRRVRQPILE